MKPLRCLPGMLVAALLTASGHAQTITEFAIPTPGSQPPAIVTGPDGALWFTEGNGSRIGRITTAGVVTEYPVPTSDGWPTGIAVGSDGALWFTERIRFKIGRITTAGAVTEYPVPTVASFPTGIVTGSDGALWFVEVFAGKIGRITTAGVVTEFPLANPNSQPTGITAGPDGALWFTQRVANKIGRITTDGAITEFPLPIVSNVGRNPSLIVSGPDGALWFSEHDDQQGAPMFSFIARMTTQGVLTEYPLSPVFSSPGQITVGPDGALWFAWGDKIGRITTSGALSTYPVPDPQSGPSGITAGPDGAVWFTELTKAGKIGRITVPPSPSPLVSAVLPASRSVQVGNAATSFSTIINTGDTPLSGCLIAPVTPVSGTFLYQTTNPQTNALTGTPNTPVGIPAHQAQTFFIAYTPGAPFPSTNVQLGFSCAGAPAAATIPGINSILLTFDSNPVPDIIAVGATDTNDGIARVGGINNVGAFAVSTANVGVAASITARARLLDASTPLSFTLCETNAQAQCKAPAAATVTRAFGHNDVATFSIFMQASGDIPLDPAKFRVFVEFVDAGGIVRGSTSVAVTTH